MVRVFLYTYAQPCETCYNKQKESMRMQISSTTAPIEAVYIHIPFCAKKCNYCDFCSFPEERIASEARALYIDTLASEILGYKREPRITVDTVFFGGGTPSYLGEKRLCTLLKTIQKHYRVEKNAIFGEVTLFSFGELPFGSNSGPISSVGNLASTIISACM